MKVTEQDLKMIKALKYILENGSFSLKWREATAFGVTKQWLDDLEERFKIKPEQENVDKPE